MKVSLLIQPKLNRNHGLLGPVSIKYMTDPYNLAYGALRAFQRFAAIALTSVGTDSLRPWLGTAIPQLPMYNIHLEEDMKVFVRLELQKAIQQFFTLQSQEIDTYTDEDIITAIDIIAVEITSVNRVSAKLSFTPKNMQAVLLSLEV